MLADVPFSTASPATSEHAATIAATSCSTIPRPSSHSRTDRRSSPSAAGSAGRRSASDSTRDRYPLLLPEQHDALVTVQKLLVANRGEIAVRIFRTCRRLGIATVAVVAPDDAGSLHARSADETVEIAGYLHSEEHIRAARQTGTDAIHPRYG